ncbi:MAG: hypothetical protein FJZ58_02465 [Chlamydiae bacterium]|nr:hypothetical protein [Chlamydiota bacterium]
MQNFLYFLLFVCIPLLGAPIQDHFPPDLTYLTQALDIPPHEDLILATQARWLRKAGQERWEMQELDSTKRTLVLQWADGHGLFSPWTPSTRHYDHAIILGATVGAMQQRLNYLKKLWMTGTRFQSVVWLTGERPLDAYADGTFDGLHTESAAARFLWEQADLPPDLRALPVVFVEVPMKKVGLSYARPTTGDTIVSWLHEHQPSPCTALFVSSQPFCGYQFSVIHTLLPEDIFFDVVGEGVDPTLHSSAAAVTLDTLARWIYQESLRLSQ